MARITSMVVKLDNGKYRTIKLHKVKSIYADQKYLCDGNIEPGHGDVAGPETDKPDFKEEADWEALDSQDNESGDSTNNGNGGTPPNCYWLDGVLVCI
jgi:hypothetical protein